MTEVLPSWYREFLRYNGVREIKGSQHAAEIMRLIEAADGRPGDGKNLQGISDDETSYCSSALCGAMELVGIPSPRNAAARSWEKWGEMLGGPAVGAVAVLWRESPTSWKGHVGLVAGRNNAGKLIIYGANQDDQFKYSAFDVGRVLSYRWPSGQPRPSKIGFPKLPITSASPSRGEA